MTKRKVPTHSPALMIVMTAIIVLALLFLASQCSAQTTFHAARPTEYVESCPVFMGRIKGQMLDVTRKELDLNQGNKRAIRFYQHRLTDVLTTHDMVVSDMTCTTDSRRDLRMILQKWELDYVQEKYGPQIEHSTVKGW